MYNNSVIVLQLPLDKTIMDVIKINQLNTKALPLSIDHHDLNVWSS